VDAADVAESLLLLLAITMIAIATTMTTIAIAIASPGGRRGITTQ
jgi:hypothetical protein